MQLLRSVGRRAWGAAIGISTYDGICVMFRTGPPAVRGGSTSSPPAAHKLLSSSSRLAVRDLLEGAGLIDGHVGIER